VFRLRLVLFSSVARQKTSSLQLLCSCLDFGSYQCWSHSSHWKRCRLHLKWCLVPPRKFLLLLSPRPQWSFQMSLSANQSNSVVRECSCSSRIYLVLACLTKTGQSLFAVLCFYRLYSGNLHFHTESSRAGQVRLFHAGRSALAAFCTYGSSFGSSEALSSSRSFSFRHEEARRCRHRQRSPLSRPSTSRRSCSKLTNASSYWRFGAFALGSGGQRLPYSNQRATTLCCLSISLTHEKV
jgi:hypothetical protein